jgi:serine/threonine protein kinase/predicted Zn-dependent protease
MSPTADEPRSACKKCGAFLQPGEQLGGHCVTCLLDLAWDEEDPTASSELFDHYQVATHADGSPVELGRGAMGVTYRASDTILRHDVALKVIDVSIAAHPKTQERFLREARAAARLRHPNVASVFYYGVRKSDGQCFYAMELVEGETLEAHLRRSGPMPTPLALEIVSQVARALVAAEGQSLVHRDLKPANLMLVNGAELTVKVIDFGLAKSAAAADETDFTRGNFVGTLAFASPEQFAGGRADARSDFFSLGATLWYLLCGEAPFPDRLPSETPERRPDPPPSFERLRAAHVPHATIAFTRSLLAADPLDRPQTAQEFAAALARCRKASMSPWWWRRNALVAALALGTAAALAAICTYFLPIGHDFNSREKSIAVLPFDNLNDDLNNTVFSEGVQEDLRTNLGKVADLKVISRNSASAYRDRSTRPTTREMGNALGVAYLLEGSVRSAGGVVRVTAELVDASTDRQVWAERYDRDLSDLFSIQSDLAERITQELRAKLSAEEKTAIEEPPTRDIVAWELWLRAHDLLYNFAAAADRRATLLDGVRLLQEAVKRAPGFGGAYCTIAEAHDLLYVTGLERTPARCLLAENALEQAGRLHPAPDELHFARAFHLLSCGGDDGQVLQELEEARRKAPNDARIPQFVAKIKSKRGLWEEALRDMKRAYTLDPLSDERLHDLSWYYAYLHRYGDAVSAIDRGFAVGLRSKLLILRRAVLCFNANGDTAPLHAALREVGPVYDPDGNTTLVRINVALWDRDFKEGARVLEADTHSEFHDNDYVFPRAFKAGLIARAQRDAQKTQLFFEAVRPLAEQAVFNQPDDPKALSLLAQVDAALGRREDALREANRALAMAPISKNANLGTDLAVDLAQVYAWTGQRDLAFQQLRSLVKTPKALDYGQLKLDPIWDDLRDDPRLDDLLSDLAAISQPIK